VGHCVSWSDWLGSSRITATSPLTWSRTTATSAQVYNKSHPNHSTPTWCSQNIRFSSNFPLPLFARMQSRSAAVGADNGGGYWW
jgi:hypothetical protein